MTNRWGQPTSERDVMMHLNWPKFCAEVLSDPNYELRLFNHKGEYTGSWMGVERAANQFHEKIRLEQFKNRGPR